METAPLFLDSYNQWEKMRSSKMKNFFHIQWLKNKTPSLVAHFLKCQKLNCLTSLFGVVILTILYAKDNLESNW